MEKLKNFLSLFLFLFILNWFNYLEKTTVAKHIMYSGIDSQVPFVKEFVIPYLFWYVYIFFGFLYLGFNSTKDFYRLYLFLFIGMSIACIIYMVYPNGQHLRPHIVQNDFFSNVIKRIYAYDTPTDVFPSIHVINTIGVFTALYNCEKLKDKHLFQGLSLTVTVLICISTLFIKQHSFDDVLGAIVISTFLYFLIYKIMPKLFGLSFFRRKQNSVA